MFRLTFGLWLLITVQLTASPMNFVVIFTDEMPPEYLGAYGGQAFPTPNLDQLAADGIRFDNAFSTAPMCTPARYAIQTGRYPGRCLNDDFSNHSALKDEPYRVAWNTRIQSREPTLAKSLQQQGYLTGMVGKWHLMPHELEKQLPRWQAHQNFDDEAGQTFLKHHQKELQKHISKTGGYTHPRNMIMGNWEQSPMPHSHNIPWITKGAISLLREFAQQDQPFFLMTTPTGIHGPWHADSLNNDLRKTPSGHEEDIYNYAPDHQQLRKETLSMSSGNQHKHVGLTDIDHHVGLVRRELQKLGLANNTAIIFTADHGIEPAKASVYDRGLRVPMLVYWPKMTQGSTTSSSLIQHLDITATIALAAGVPQNSLNMDGLDCRPTLKHPQHAFRKIAYFECGYSRSIFDGRHKLISTRLGQSVIDAVHREQWKWLTVGMGQIRGAHAAFSQLAYPHYYEPDQIYDLDQDPYEQQNLWNHPELRLKRQQLVRDLQSYTRGFRRPFPEQPHPFIHSNKYRELIKKTKAENNPHTTDWVKRDHDAIHWPPRE